MSSTFWALPLIKISLGSLISQRWQSNCEGHWCTKQIKTYSPPTYITNNLQLFNSTPQNTNNLLPSYFNSFTLYYNNENHNHDLRYRILRLPMTRHEYYVQCTKYQLLRLIRETPPLDLNRCTQLNIVQFSAYFKYSFINNYNPVCSLKHCHVCG